MGWTNEQTDAINTFDTGIGVPAAAGSGKTSVLIERIITILADEKMQITPDRLLAVTFTVDATSNMKTRLTYEFEKRLALDPDNEWLKKQQSALSLAKIRTINAFCFDFVKEHSSSLDIRDDVSILEAEEESVMFDAAIAKVLDDAYKNEPAMMKTLNDALCQDNDKELIKHIISLDRVLNSVPYCELWTQRLYDDLFNGRAYKNYIETLLDHALMKLSSVKKKLDYLYYIVSSFTGYDKLVTIINNDADLLDSFIRQVEKRSVEGIKKVLSDNEWSELRGITSAQFKKHFGADSELKLKAYERFKKERKIYIKTVDDIAGLLDRDEAKDKKQLEFVGILFKGISKLTLAARAELFDMKLDKNAVSFADVEDMTVRLLLTPADDGYKRTELAEDIRKNGIYKMILIDEFQDVNDLQELIFKALSDTDDTSVLGRNVFVVGDVKQSIYGFRQANPELFIDAVSKAHDIGEGTPLTRIRLSNNFRSRENVINFVNYLFARIMSPQVGNVLYDDSEKLYYQADFTPADIPTDIIYLQSSDKSDDDEDGSDSEHNKEHIAVANYIYDMIQSGVNVKDDKKEIYRPCRASDFCVLVRNNAAQNLVAKALETVGLRSLYENTEGYLKSREILVMINLLRVIDSPLNDLAMLSVMLSPVFGFTADEVTKIRLLCDQDDSGVRKKLYQVILAVSKGDDTHEKETKKISIDDKALEDKCIGACGLIRKFRYYASSMPLEALIKKIYDETDFYSVASAYENSSQMRANLRLLIEYAAGYDSSGGGGLSGFIRYFEKIESRGSDFSQATVTANDGDAVIIKTMHKSKGLEYPFIVLCDLGSGFNLKDVSDSFICDRNYGIGIKYHNVYDLSCGENISHEAMSIRLRQKLLSEEMRLLYVALTRAKERICIPVCFRHNASRQYDTYAKLYKDLSKISDGGVYDGVVSECTSFLEWIMIALGSRSELSPLIELINDNERAYHEAKKDKNKGDFVPLVMKENDDDSIRLRVMRADTKERGSITRSFVPEPADEALVKKLDDNFKKDRSNDRKNIIAKLSVTEIVRLEQEENEKQTGEPAEFYPRLPKLDEENDDLTHAERGTFTHLFMELADYSKAERDVSSELERLKALKLFSQREAGGVYVAAVEMFFASSFYKRMKASKKIMREKHFLARIDELDLGEDYLGTKGSDAFVQGIADCIFEEDDGYVIVDYKTDRFKTLSEMDKYKTQLRLYKAAFDILLDKKVKSCYIYSFWLGQGREIIF